jgi:hypothetical protein
MKTLILLAALFSTQAFAISVCKYDETSDLTEAIAHSRYTKTESKNHKKFTKAELKLIHKTISAEDFYAGKKLTEAEALHIFGDYYEDETETGSDAGEIDYYIVGTQQIIIVHYWPGENEYGAIFEIKAGKTVHVANIGDSFISCL